MPKSQYDHVPPSPLANLDWINDDEYQNSYKEYKPWERLWEKTRKDPLIPVGVVATCCALSYGLFAFQRGDKMMQQYMMRARVGFQAFTIAIFAFGTAGISKLRETWIPQKTENGEEPPEFQSITLRKTSKFVKEKVAKIKDTLNLKESKDE